MFAATLIVYGVGRGKDDTGDRIVEQHDIKFEPILLHAPGAAYELTARVVRLEEGAFSFRFAQEPNSLTPIAKKNNLLDWNWSGQAWRFTVAKSDIEKAYAVTRRMNQANDGFAGSFRVLEGSVEARKGRWSSELKFTDGTELFPAFEEFNSFFEELLRQANAYRAAEITREERLIADSEIAHFVAKHTVQITSKPMSRGKATVNLSASNWSASFNSPEPRQNQIAQTAYLTRVAPRTTSSADLAQNDDVLTIVFLTKFTCLLVPEFETWMNEQRGGIKAYMNDPHPSHALTFQRRFGSKQVVLTVSRQDSDLSSAEARKRQAAALMTVMVRP